MVSNVLENVSGLLLFLLLRFIHLVNGLQWHQWLVQLTMVYVETCRRLIIAKNWI